MKSRSSSSATSLAGTVLATALAMASPSTHALEFRSVESAAIFYDSPSQKGKRLFVVRRLTPLEIVVNLEGWAKVRDADGTLAWIEKKLLSDKRTAIVTAPRAEIRQAPDAASALVFEAEKGVALELVEPGRDGWARVSHADGQGGYVRTTQVWGL